MTGSLYLLADLAAVRPERPTMAQFRDAERLRLRRVVLAAFVGLAFAAGYIIGKLLL